MCAKRKKKSHSLNKNTTAKSRMSTQEEEHEQGKEVNMSKEEVGTTVRVYELLKPTIDRNRGEYTQDLCKIFWYLVNHLSK